MNIAGCTPTETGKGQTEASNMGQVEPAQPENPVPANEVIDPEEVIASQPPPMEPPEEPPWSDDMPNPADDYPGDPGEDVVEMAMEIIDKLWGPDSGIELEILTEKFRASDMWIWEVSFDHGITPVARALVRLDLGYVISLDAFHNDQVMDLVPKASSEGSDEPDLVAESLGLSESGYQPARWLNSSPGFMMYRKHVEINGERVSVGNIMIRFSPEKNLFIGMMKNEFKPVESFSILFDQEEALKNALAYMEGSNELPSHIQLVQIQDGPDAKTDLHVYWEFAFPNAYIYVNVEDGGVAVSEIGMTEPIIF